ncbi:MAG: glycoside hydrolase family 31 protein [Verrucomicrobia bacterium]|nr:glycoside hydrolase family 31 protein [Verrucomicrobiota bacterium]
MKILFSICIVVLGLTLRLQGFETQGLVPIGRVVSASNIEQGLMINCAGGSTVQIIIMADDLVRVRARFTGQPVGQDRSWAVVRTEWPAVETSFAENSSSFSISTKHLQVRVQKDPLVISFVDRSNGSIINADERPISRDPTTGRVAVFKRLGLEEHFYGLGERTAHLDRRRSEFTLWNSDTPGYVEGTDPLYQSIPFYLGMEQSRAYGIFYDNSFKASIDFGHNGQEYAGFCAEGGEINYYFFAGSSVRSIVSRYADLTGHMPMPPLWALGHHQSRYSYYPDSMVEKVVATYRAHDLPLDAVYLDIHYMNGFRSFTWDRSRFPDPKGLTERLAAQGVRVVTIVDPGIKHQPHAATEPGYTVYDSGTADGHFLKRKDGSTYIGSVWPGKAVFADYTREQTRLWWGNLHAEFLDQGVAGFWNDMNEPSDFVDKSGASQADVVFEDGGRTTSYLENRNLFALLMCRATFEGLSRLRPDTRTFVITRAGYAGIQRYAVTWTGDNNATWESLALSLPMFQSMGLSGQAFVGADIPGFIGRADGELLARSYQVACFAPFFRNHAAVDVYDHEPWRFGPQYEVIVRKYIKLRYQLLPYLYTCIEEAHRTGLPLFRPLLLNFQSDPAVANLDDQFMFGDALMAAPILRPGERAREVYLPEGVWYDFWTGEQLATTNGLHRFEAPLDHLPLFVRGGNIVPSTKSMNHVHEKPWSPVRFDIYPDASGYAAGSLYEDDGLTMRYQQGAFRRTSVHFSADTRLLRLTIDAPIGSYQPSPRNLELVLHGTRTVTRVQLDGQTLQIITSSVSTVGWFRDASGLLTLRLPDDGRAHTFELY